VASPSGSSGGHVTINPQRAYVDLPRQMTSTSAGHGISTVRASAKLLGGMTQLSASRATKDASSNFFGSTSALSTL